MGIIEWAPEIGGAEDCVGVCEGGGEGARVVEVGGVDFDAFCSPLMLRLVWALSEMVSVPKVFQKKCNNVLVASWTYCFSGG